MKREKEERRSYTGLIALALFLAVVIGIGSLVVKGINKVNYYKNYNEAFKPDDDTQIEFTVKRGETYTSFAERLREDYLLLLLQRRFLLRSLFHQLNPTSACNY